MAKRIKMQNRHTRSLLAAGAMVLLAVAGLANGSGTEQSEVVVARSNAEAESAAAVTPSTGTSSAPITFRYEVLGNPIVGQPVSVNVTVSSAVTDTPISLDYRVTDASSMQFAESQALRTEIVFAAGDEPSSHQITVIPQREGRLYLNVSAEIRGDKDTLMKTMSIPIQVAAAPLDVEEADGAEEGDSPVLHNSEN